VDTAALQASAVFSIKMAFQTYPDGMGSSFFASKRGPAARKQRGVHLGAVGGAEWEGGTGGGFGPIGGLRAMGARRLLSK
jgi:hypothetical protein